MNISILGAGAWGTAMALHLHRCGHTVTLVPRRCEMALSLASSRENTVYLPGHILPQSIQIAAEKGPALMEAEVVFLACPSKGLRELCQELKEALQGAWQLRLFVVLCKGLELKALRPHPKLFGNFSRSYPVGFCRAQLMLETSQRGCLQRLLWPQKKGFRRLLTIRHRSVQMPCVCIAHWTCEAQSLAGL